MKYHGIEYDSLTSALIAHPTERDTIYKVWYSNPQTIRELLLDFEVTDPLLIEIRKSHILEEDYDPNIAYYVRIREGEKGKPKVNSIRVIRPIYSLLDVDKNLYLEDMPQYVLQEYQMYIKDGVRELIDGEGYIMWQSLDGHKLNF